MSDSVGKVAKVEQIEYVTSTSYTTICKNEYSVYLAMCLDVPDPESSPDTFATVASAIMCYDEFIEGNLEHKVGSFAFMRNSGPYIQGRVYNEDKMLLVVGIR